jgi:hypothetical protein
MKTLIIFSLLSLFTCESVIYDGETKIILKGKVVDNNNNPIINNEVNVYVPNDLGNLLSGNSFFDPVDELSVAKTKTNSSGDYTIVIPSPEYNFSEIIIETNSDKNNLNRKQFNNIQLKNFKNYELNLPVSELYQKSELTELLIIPNKTNKDNELKKIELIGILANEIEIFNKSEAIDLSYKTLWFVKKNQNLTLRYTILDVVKNTTSTAEQNIEIGSLDNTKYTLNY